MSEDCPHCVFEKTEANCPGCFEGSHYRPKPQTNADRLRAMSDEELAEWIGNDPMHDICPNNCHEDLDRPCKVCAFDWLRQEATE